MRIAILDADPAQLQLASDVLARAGHHCHSFRRGRDLMASMRKETYDLVLLDRDPGDMPGDEVLRWVRASCHAELPVLFMTARAAAHNIVQALDAGADDCLVKPFDPAVLVAKVSALLRRSCMREAPASRLEYREFAFDLKAQRAYRCGEQIPLSPKQFQVAVLLFRNVGRPLSRAHIFESVWKQRCCSDTPLRTVDTHVWAVRSSLQLRPDNGYLLGPVFCYGYLLDHIGDSFAGSGGDRCGEQRPEGGTAAGGPDTVASACMEGERKMHGTGRSAAAYPWGRVSSRNGR